MKMVFVLSIFIRLLKVHFGPLTYLIVTVPIAVVFFFKVIKRSNFYFNNYDLVICALFFFNAITMVFSSIRSDFSVSFIIIIYITFPLIVYALFRLKKIEVSEFNKIIYLFTFIYSLYLIIEFSIYFAVPGSTSLISNYFEFVVKNNNFYAPRITYPIIGFNFKPWGPMLDASASGTFLVVLYAYLLDTYKSVDSRYKVLFVPITLLAIFLSGSRSAYFVLIVFYVVRYVFINFNHLTYQKLLYSFVALLIGCGFLSLMLSFFFPPDLLAKYFFVMVQDPFYKAAEGFYMNGFYSIIGAGQENKFFTVYGLGEVDFFNAIFRYGVLFMVTLFSLLWCLIFKFRLTHQSFSLMFLMFVFSMVHYQVMLKFPASMILFASIAVLVNDKEDSVR